MRGILASTVVFFHLPTDGWLWKLPYIQNGFLAVPFFFVLSGFVIGTTYGDKLAKGFPLTSFLGLRLGRIYPLHLFMLVLMIIYQALRVWLHIGAARDIPPFTDRFDPSLIWYNVLLLQKFAGVLSWNDPSWSIGVEWWTYAIFALLAAFITMRRGRLVSVVLLIVPWLFCKARNIDLGDGPTFTFLCMMNFGLGLAVCEVRTWQLWKLTDRIGPVAGTLLELFALALGVWMIGKWGWKLSLLIYPVFAFVIAVFSLERGLFSRLFTTSPMLLLGELSYSIYMVHHFILDRMVDLVWFYGEAWHLPIHATATGRKTIVGNPLACDLFSFLVLGAVVLVSLYSLRYVEKPARQWSRRVLLPKPDAKIAKADPAAAF